MATGKPGHPTPAGHFHVMEKNEDKISNLYGSLKDSNGEVVNSDFNYEQGQHSRRDAVRAGPHALRQAGDG